MLRSPTCVCTCSRRRSWERCMFTLVDWYVLRQVQKAWIEVLLLFSNTISFQLNAFQVCPSLIEVLFLPDQKDPHSWFAVIFWGKTRSKKSLFHVRSEEKVWGGLIGRVWWLLKYLKATTVCVTSGVYARPSSWLKSTPFLSYACCLMLWREAWWA